VSAFEDFPYLPPPPGARLIETLRVRGPLELRPATAGDEAVLAGAEYVRKSYAPMPAPPAPPFLVTYRDALFTSGWKLIDVMKIDVTAPPGNVDLSAHYREQGRNLYARLTLESGGTYRFSVADVGAEDWAAALARECRLRVPSIHFDLDAASLKLAESEPTLRKLAQLLAAAPAAGVEIQGHTDSIGEAAAAARQELSEKRALAVTAWLTTHGGVPAAKVSARGYGRSRPIAENDTDLGRALNRRIEVAAQGCSR
jgi:outer membrane protein OmpA-like peptidoglycan-associated protein